MAVIGAILGDIAGSQFEFDRPKDLDWKHCELFSDRCKFTDDTVMTLAVKKAIDEDRGYADCMHELGREYLDRGYGNRFYKWLLNDLAPAYNSLGNGSAMRVSYVGEHFTTLDDVIREARNSAAVTHNHHEGMKGAEVTAVCIWMARHGNSKEDIYDYVISEYPPEHYEFSIDKDMKYLEKHYSWDVTCMTSITVAMRCFYESDSFESFMRNVFRLDCDSDTLGAIGGAVAEEFYHGVGFAPKPVLERYLDDRLYKMLF